MITYVYFPCRVKLMSSSLAWSMPGPCASLLSVWPTASRVPSLRPSVSDTQLPCITLVSGPIPFRWCTCVRCFPSHCDPSPPSLPPASRTQTVWICCCSPRHSDTVNCEPDAHSAPVSAQSSSSLCLLLQADRPSELHSHTQKLASTWVSAVLPSVVWLFMSKETCLNHYWKLYIKWLRKFNIL